MSVAGRIRWTLLIALCGGTLALAPLASTARAGGDVLDRRLTALRVRPELRRRVTDAVGRGVAHLLSRARDDGQFEDDDGAAALHNLPGSRSRVETTALAAWALAASGTDGGAAAADRAVAALVPDTGRAAPELRVRVLATSFTVMALCARARREGAAQELARRLQGFQDETTGYWGYAMVDGGSDEGNLFTSHFAALALREATTTDSKPWEWVLRRFGTGVARSMRSDGVWGFAPGPDAPPCPVGTCLGVFGLGMVREGITKSDEDAPLRAWIDRQLGAAERSFDRDGAIVMGLARGEWRRAEWMVRGQPGTSAERPESHLDLLCLASACAEAEHELLEGQSWYELATELILDRQNDDGGWGRTGALARGAARASRVDETSYALLVLTRATERQRRRDAVRRPASTPIDTAWPLLDEFQQLLEDGNAPVELAQASLDDLRFAYLHLAPARGKEAGFATDARRWREGADLLLIRALGLVRKTSPADAKLWERFRLDAADALSHSGPSASAALRGVLERAALSPRAKPSDGLTAAAFGALARQGDPGSANWFADRACTFDINQSSFERCVIALRALSRLDGVPGTQRLLIATRVVEVFRPYAPGQAGQDRRAEAATARVWGQVESGVVRALRHLCRDPATGRMPGATFELWSSDFADIASWLARHADPDEPPWK